MLTNKGMNKSKLSKSTSKQVNNSKLIKTKYKTLLVLYRYLISPELTICRPTITKQFMFIERRDMSSAYIVTCTYWKTVTSYSSYFKYENHRYKTPCKLRVQLSFYRSVKQFPLGKVSKNHLDHMFIICLGIFNVCFGQ